MSTGELQLYFAFEPGIVFDQPISGTTDTFAERQDPIQSMPAITLNQLPFESEIKRTGISRWGFAHAC